MYFKTKNFNNTRKLQLILIYEKKQNHENNKCIPSKQIFSEEKPSVISIRLEFFESFLSYFYFLQVGCKEINQ